MITPVALPQVLAAREARVLRQRRMLADYGCPVVSLTLVTPGPVKDSPAYRALRDEAVAQLTRTCRDRSWAIRACQPFDAATGPEALVAVDSPALALKAAMVGLEDELPAGRLLDLDVLAPSGEDGAPLSPLSRADQNLPPRRCLVCERPARECARAAVHPLPELLRAVGALLATVAVPAPMVHAPEVEKAPALVWAEHLGELARQALLAEVHHTPKPGLVDERNTGAHTDMDLALFERSAAAIAPYLPRFVLAGADAGNAHPHDDLAFLGAVRPLGVACENAMFTATDGVNTHKGAVFAFGLVLTAAGRLLSRGEIPGPAAACAEAGRIAACTLPELARTGADAASAPRTAGEQWYDRTGEPGARGEAASGFATVRHHALPAYDREYARTGQVNSALHAAMLHLLTQVEDTNLAKDGGVAAMETVRAGGRAILARPADTWADGLTELDDRLIAAGLSPGGCADLLALTWFLAHWPEGSLLAGGTQPAR